MAASSGIFSSDEVYAVLNDLAERRNEVAHGVPSQILSNDILVNYIEYFRVFSFSLSEIVEGSLDRLNVEENGNYLGEITACFKNGIVVCFNCSLRKIMKGEYIFGLNNNNFEKARILNIKLNDLDIECTDETQSYEIGILLDKPFKSNYKLYSIS